MSKIQIESNSQHSPDVYNRNASCIYHVKDTNRKQFTTSYFMHTKLSALYLSCQRYKSKAIHNTTKGMISYPSAVFIMSKIQIESNSQQREVASHLLFCCIYHVKDTNRKQFTTENAVNHNSLMLYLSCQRYKSKAIHN